MKIIVFDSKPDAGRIPDIELMPDSTIVPGVQPMFLADFSAAWTGLVYVALRVSRLGKNIAPRFAPRYYDAVTLALRAVPEEMRLPSGALPPVAAAIDSTLSIGHWREPTPGESMTAAGPMAPDGETFDPVDVMADAAISRLSRYMTLKTGDVVMWRLLGAPLRLGRGTTLDFSLDATPALHIKIR